jgi:hypothetical protein
MTDIHEQYQRAVGRKGAAEPQFKPGLDYTIPS